MLTFLFLNQTLWCYHSLESSRRDDFNEGHIIGFGWKMGKLSWKLFCSLFLNCSPGGGSEIGVRDGSCSLSHPVQPAGFKFINVFSSFNLNNNLNPWYAKIQNAFFGKSRLLYFEKYHFLAKSLTVNCMRQTGRGQVQVPYLWDVILAQTCLQFIKSSDASVSQLKWKMGSNASILTIALLHTLF